MNLIVSKNVPTTNKRLIVPGSLMLLKKYLVKYLLKGNMCAQLLLLASNTIVIRWHLYDEYLNIHKGQQGAAKKIVTAYKSGYVYASWYARRM